MPGLFTVKLSSDCPSADSKIEAAIICLSVFQMKSDNMSGMIPDEFRIFTQEIRQLGEKGLFTGEAGEVQLLRIRDALPYEYLALIGIGASLDGLRRGAAKAAKSTQEHHIESLLICLPELAASDPAATANALAEGFLLGLYNRKDYRKEPKKATAIKEIILRVEAREPREASIKWEAVVKAIQNAEIMAEATNYARDLINLPGNYMVPDDLAIEASKLALHYGFECAVLGTEEIERLGMGALQAVGKGSVYPPRMIALTYRGLPSSTDVLGLVGKGITFDTGGISLKKADGMEEMISDMGGAATVLGVMQAIGKLRPSINIITVIAAAENMPSGSAFKPGDIVTSMSGHTIEVLNTDAEGRMVLADAVTYALSLGANKLIDVATLTGAVLVSLGDVATGAVTNDEAFLHKLLAASRQTGEKIWQLPAYPEYREMLRSAVADLKNSTAQRWAGSITGGLFIGFFAMETPWIHLDTGGTAWLWSEQGVDPVGGTGVMVRTIVKMITNNDF